MIAGSTMYNVHGTVGQWDSLQQASLVREVMSRGRLRSAFVRVLSYQGDNSVTIGALINMVPQALFILYTSYI